MKTSSGTLNLTREASCARCLASQLGDPCRPKLQALCAGHQQGAGAQNRSMRRAQGGIPSFRVIWVVGRAQAGEVTGFRLPPATRLMTVWENDSVGNDRNDRPCGKMTP